MKPFQNLRPSFLRRAVWLGSVALLAVFATSIKAAPKPEPKTASFEHFERRARAGERLNVVFFGASLTWGANSSDPPQTSYRANMARHFEAAYPRAHFRFVDAAIGGTGSQLGVFRLERDVLRHKPDLVFLDFSANDNIYSDSPQDLASYESLVRRIVSDGKCPLVQVIFPFGWNIKPGEMAKMKRRDAHLAIARAYNAAVGDAVQLVTERVESGATTVEKLWPLDFGHPGDNGYALFAEAAWQGFRDGVARRLTPRAPQNMLFAPTYMKWNRVRLSSIGALPPGWKVGIPNRTSAYFDFLMSRWLDDEIIASNRREEKDAAGKISKVAQQVGNLKLKFQGSVVLLLGEVTLQSGKYRVVLDGKLLERPLDGKTVAEFDPGAFAKAINGNGHHVQLLATGLDASVEHTLEIEPRFDEDTEGELRLESVCVAGGAARVWAP